jgi:hypothetical protein
MVTAVLASVLLCITAKQALATQRPRGVSETRCDRDCLTGLVDQYLAAMVKHDPSGLPLANAVKYTEDTAAISVGDGLWVGASELPTTFKIYAADVTTGQVGFFGLMKEFGRPVLLALRLKAEKGKITEIEHVVARNIRGPGMANLVTPRAGFLQSVPPSERVSRREMLRIADSYFDSIEQNNGNVAQFADDCERHENGGQTTTNKPPDPAVVDPARLASARVDALGCKDQMSSGNLAYITRIRPRRMVIIDEERGLVFGFPMFVHRGNVRSVKIIGVPGVESLPKEFGPINLQAGEIFKIRGGKIHEIEANGVLVPYGSKSGWE